MKVFCEWCGTEILNPRTPKNNFFTQRFCCPSCRVMASANRNHRETNRHYHSGLHKKHYNLYMKNYYKNNKEKFMSCVIIKQLLNEGKIEMINKCKICKSETNLIVHREDICPTKIKDIEEYVKQGKIYYLCKKCHSNMLRKRDKSMKRGIKNG